MRFHPFYERSKQPLFDLPHGRADVISALYPPKPQRAKPQRAKPQRAKPQRAKRGPKNGAEVRNERASFLIICAI